MGGTPGPGRTVSAASAPPGNYTVRKTHQTNKKERVCSFLPLLPSALKQKKITSPFASSSYQSGISFFLKARVDFIAPTETDHAMTERALGTSTESIIGN